VSLIANRGVSATSTCSVTESIVSFRRSTDMCLMDRVSASASCLGQGRHLASQGTALPGKSSARTTKHPKVIFDPAMRSPRSEKTAMPAGGQGIDWYRYVLSSGEAGITGFHRDTLKEVRAHATSYAEDFNLRSVAGKSTHALAFLAFVISNTNLQITGNFGSEYPTGEMGWTGE
jgi:hypothetical protein